MFDLFSRRGGKTVALTALAASSLSAIAFAANPAIHRGYPSVRYAGARPFATTNLYAGGATLPALGYNGVNPPAGSNGPVKAAAGSAYYYAFPFASNIVVNYCLTGSGEGKKVFEGVAGYTANLSCNPTSGNQGFSAPSVKPNWADSDSPLSQSDYSAFTYASTNTEPTQLPTVIGSIALLYNNSYILSPTQINITTKTLCLLADGQITTWQSLASQAGTSITFKSTIPKNYPLLFGYRTDGSGTTFNFSNFLSENCPSNGGQTYALDQQFKAVAPSTEQVLPQGNSATNLIGAKGNNGLTTLITATPGTIGYVESANAKAARTGATENFATFNGNDPIAALPAAVASIKQAPLKDEVIGAYVPNGRPNPDAVRLSPAPRKAGCVLLQDPLNFAAIAATSGYQLIAFSYHELYESGNGATATTLQSGLLYLVNPRDYTPAGPITTINEVGTSPGTNGTGYSSVPVASQSAVSTAISTTKCINS